MFYLSSPQYCDRYISDMDIDVCLDDTMGIGVISRKITTTGHGSSVSLKISVELYDLCGVEGVCV